MSATGFLALGDFNGDGMLDWASNSNLLALGNGDGTFQAPAPFIPTVHTGSIFGIAAARLTKYKVTDIVLTAPTSDLVYVLLSTGTGFKETTFFSDANNVYCYEPGSVVLADVNGDGSPDILLECAGAPDTPIFVNNGEGEFTYSTELDDGLTIGDGYPMVADVNGDGIADVMIVSGSDIAVFIGEGSMTFESPFYLGTLGSPSDIFALNAHGQQPKSGLPDLIVPDGSGVLDVILNTAAK
jgi:hypothetical protein